MEEKTVMDVLLLTNNQHKVNFIINAVKGLGIVVHTPKELGIKINAKEDGVTAVENAIIKARAGSKISRMSTFGWDMGMRIEKLPENLQPNLHIRRPFGEEELSDADMVEYWRSLIEKTCANSESLAHYFDGVALVLDGQIINSTSFNEDPFVMTAKKKQAGIAKFNAFDQIRKTLDGKYFCELSDEENLQYDKSRAEHIRQFFQESLAIIKNLPQQQATGLDLVSGKLMQYIEKKIFPMYQQNDLGHNIVHIKEVIRRCFVLNQTFNLKLNEDMIFAMAAYHDLGKHLDHEHHHLIAGKLFFDDQNMKSFFNEQQMKIIREAIEDHRSSKADAPRSIYGKLISSADRNTSIEIVFIRSFFVAHERMPEENIETYLDYTIKRLSKKYSEENPENMFYEDDVYKKFLIEMRKLLKDPDKFKQEYCRINHIKSRNHKVREEEGRLDLVKTNIAPNVEKKSKCKRFGILDNEHIKA